MLLAFWSGFGAGGVEALSPETFTVEGFRV